MGSPLPRKQDIGSLPFRRWFIVTRMTELREAVGLSPEAAAKAAGVHGSVVYRLENAETLPQARTLRDLLGVYRADQQTADLLMDLRREPDSREWWEPYRGDLPGDYGLYISCERRATSVHNYEFASIPGLLQTEEYARALFHAKVPDLPTEEAERRVAVRMGRQDVLRGTSPIALHAIVDEDALTRPLGADFMPAQLAALTNLPPSVTLQVIPRRVWGYPEMGWPFVVVQLRDPRAPTLVFTERSAGHSVVDGDNDLNYYSLVWQRLSAAALSPEESTALIAALL